jgi:carboxypeptidase Q
MNKLLLSLLLTSLSLHSLAQTNARDSVMINKIFDEALVNGKGYQWLEMLTKNIGARLSGSPGADRAVAWCDSLCRSIVPDGVTLQPVTVPYWVRGAKEEVMLLEKGQQPVTLAACALGGSVATPAEGLLAPVVMVHSFEELEKLGEANIKGKIVFYTYEMDQRFINTFGAYADAVGYRWRGPSEAARFGAVASITRSIAINVDDFPHTGSMRYIDSLPKIPCAAISTKAAELLEQRLKENKQFKINMKLNCQTLADKPSHNVIAEIKGNEFPDQIIVIGGHLDAWDNGEGAHDDGAGIMHTVEVLRLFKAIGYQPKRTIRVVSFMNEENGLRGGKAYAQLSEKLEEKHIAAIESDEGGFTPIGFGIDANSSQFNKIKTWQPLLEKFGLWHFTEGGGGADISPLKPQGVPLMNLAVDSQRYFEYHHTANDTFDKVHKRELHLGTAAMAAMVYLISEYGL